MIEGLEYLDEREKEEKSKKKRKEPLVLPHERAAIKTAAVQRGIMKSEDMEDLHHLVLERDSHSMKHFLKEHERQKNCTNPNDNNNTLK